MECTEDEGDAGKEPDAGAEGDEARARRGGERTAKSREEGTFAMGTSTAAVVENVECVRLEPLRME